MKASQTKTCEYYKLGLDKDFQIFSSHHNLTSDLNNLIFEVVKWNCHQMTILGTEIGNMETTNTYAHQSQQPTPVALFFQIPVESGAHSRAASTQIHITTGTETKEGRGYRLIAEEFLRIWKFNQCSYCGSSGHTVANCTNPCHAVRELTPDPSVNHLLYSSGTSCLLISIAIHGQRASITTLALLETGAEFNFLDCKLTTSLSLINKDLIISRAANGAPVNFHWLSDCVLFSITGSSVISEFI